MSETFWSAVASGDSVAAEAAARDVAVDAAGPEGMTPLMWAARRGDLATMAQLLSRGAPLEARDDRGLSALFYASYDPDHDCGRPAAVQWLIDAGADIECAIGFGVRPLMYAAGNGEAEVVQALLAAGADPTARNEMGRTALMMVKDRNYVDVINLLHMAESQKDSGSCGSRNAPNQQVITFRKPS